MTEKIRRFQKGLAVALFVHLGIAVLLGVAGFSYKDKKVDEIIEVNLFGGSQGQGIELEESKKQKEKTSIDDVFEKNKHNKQKEKSIKEIVEKKAEHIPSSSTLSKEGLGREGRIAGKENGADKASGKGRGVGNDEGSSSNAAVPVTIPRLISKVDPHYPKSARNKEIEGTTYVKMLVSSSGKVTNVFVDRSSGHQDLDASAVKAAYKWRFSPAKDKFGSLVSCYITVPVKFVLR